MTIGSFWMNHGREVVIGKSCRVCVRQRATCNFIIIISIIGRAPRIEMDWMVVN